MKPSPSREMPRALPHVAKQLGTSVGELLYTNPKKLEIRYLYLEEHIFEIWFTGWESLLDTKQSLERKLVAASGGLLLQTQSRLSERTVGSSAESTRGAERKKVWADGGIGEVRSCKRVSIESG